VVGDFSAAGAGTVETRTISNVGNNTHFAVLYQDEGGNWGHLASALIGADLALTKSDSPDPAHVGQDLVYTLTIKNTGPESATGVTVRDPLPKATGFGSASASQGSCVRSKEIVTCSLGNLAGGRTATVRILVKPTEKGTITNTASVSATSPADPKSANNTATATTTVEP
jgi:uncharacterized repeat protein (TIGR01451 family)